jgi:hypothetical protein
VLLAVMETAPPSIIRCYSVAQVKVSLFFDFRFFFLCRPPLFFTYIFVVFFPVRSCLCGVEFLHGEVQSRLSVVENPQWSLRASVLLLNSESSLQLERSARPPASRIPRLGRPPVSRLRDAPKSNTSTRRGIRYSHSSFHWHLSISSRHTKPSPCMCFQCSARGGPLVKISATIAFVGSSVSSTSSRSLASRTK